MSDSTELKLMRFVEQIVRPIRAFQSRKLQMRLELLSHVQAALEEERTRHADEAIAIEQAMRRLGDPAGLRRDLQQTVPALQRALMRKLPTPKSGERWEQRWATQLGMNHRMTMAHQLVVSSAVFILFVSAMWISARLLVKDISVLARDGPGSADAMLLITWVAMCPLFICYLAFAGHVCQRERSTSSRRRAVAFAIGAIALQAILLSLVAITFGGPHALRPVVLAGSLLASLAMLLLLASVGRAVAALRRPYDEWLFLDIEDTNHGKESLRFD